VALARAIRADTEVAGHGGGAEYAAWIRNVADTLDPSGDPPLT
jgi:hypothetical protein